MAVLDRILRQPDGLPMHSQRLQAAVRARACARTRACVGVHACALVRAHARQCRHTCVCACARARAHAGEGDRTTCKFRNLSSLISSSDWSKKFLLFLRKARSNRDRAALPLTDGMRRTSPTENP